MAVCYRDMTFCTNDTCPVWNVCHRALTDDVRAAAVKWYGSEDAPIAVANFNCEVHDDSRTV